MNFPQARPQQGEPGMTGGGQDPQGGGASPIVLNKTSMGAGTGGQAQQQPSQHRDGFIVAKEQRHGAGASGHPPKQHQGFVASDTLALA